MTPSTELMVTEQYDDEVGDLIDMFADLEPIDSFDVKKDEVAANLAALLALTGITRSEFAEKACWKKSRVTNVLSGKSNPTLRTVWEFCSRLGYDFDIVFRLFDEKRPSQPWQKTPQPFVTLSNECISGKNFFGPTLHIQTPQEVARDFDTGNHKSIYVSFAITSDYSHSCSNTIPVQLQPPMPQSSLNIPITLGSLAYAD